MVSLKVENLSKSFGTREVLRNISFSLQEGQCLVVTGPNGSGKSTLLKILCGFISLTKGDILWELNGEKVEKKKRREFLSLVSPELALYEELSALENLEFLSKVQGIDLDKNEIKKRIGDVGLEGRETDLLASFSTGMKQRLKYAFALLNNPLFLLLDEPGTNLDKAGLTLLSKIIAEQKQRGLLLIATNDPKELSYADQILQLG
jgi:heme exporter protein A